MCRLRQSQGKATIMDAFAVARSMLMKSSFEVQTRQKTELVDMTDLLASCVGDIADGLVFASTRQNTAALVVATLTPELRMDFVKVVENLLAPFRPFKQMRKNAPNAEAHIFTALLGQSLTLEVEAGQLILGEGQRVYLAEFEGPQMRRVFWKTLC
jgi:secondary thiamine-phosphate synthase enzyme